MAHADWHTDPYRRHELRYHDGEIWTEHVSDRGVPGIDTVPVAEGPRSRPPEPDSGGPPTYRREAARIVPERAAAGRHLLDAPVLLVEEPARGTGTKAGLDCVVLDQHGYRIGTVRTVREHVVAKVLRLLTSNDRREVTGVELLDGQGVRVVRLDRPAHLMKPRVTVRDHAGTVVGELVPRMTITRFLFTIEAGGQVLGGVEADHLDGSGARVSDAQGRPVARTARTWEVLAGRQHPDAGTHVVEIGPDVAQPLRTLAVAALLGVDTMLAPAAGEQPAPVTVAR